MMNKFIIASILATSGFACAEKAYRSEGSQTTTQSSAYSSEQQKANAEVAAEDMTLTPMDQSEGSKADIELTRKIREALTDSDSLSTSAQNVKIITLKGITTLRGPVNTIAEKRQIERVAKNAGAKKVKNQLEVKTKTE